MLTQDIDPGTEMDSLYERAMLLPAWAQELLTMRLVEAMEDAGDPPPQPDEHREESLGETIRRRLEEIDRGEVEMVPHEQVMAQIRATIQRARDNV